MGFHTNLRLRLEDKQNRKFLAIPWVYEFYSNRVWTRSAERIANNTPTAKIRYTVQELLSFKEHLKQHHSLLSDEQYNAFCDLVDKKPGSANQQNSKNWLLYRHSVRTFMLATWTSWYKRQILSLLKTLKTIGRCMSQAMNNIMIWSTKKPVLT